MRTWIKKLFACSIILFITPCMAIKALDVTSPVGYWKTIDDVNGQPKAIIQIVKNPDQTVYGRILKVFAEEGKAPREVCSKCVGEKHNRPIVGLIILENLQQSGNNEWSGGEILDPKTGKVYHCSLKIMEGGQKLNVRGYIGISLFGRAQTWLRVTNADKLT